MIHPNFCQKRNSLFRHPFKSVSPLQSPLTTHPFIRFAKQSVENKGGNYGA